MLLYALLALADDTVISPSAPISPRYVRATDPPGAPLPSVALPEGEAERVAAWLAVRHDLWWDRHLGRPSEKKVQRALDAALTALAAAERDAGGEIVYAAALLDAGRDGEAWAALDRALASGSDRGAVLATRGRIRARLGDHEGALRELAAAVDAGAAAPARIAWATSALHLGRLDEARTAVAPLLVAETASIQLYEATWLAWRAGACEDVFRGVEALHAQPPDPSRGGLRAEVEALALACDRETGGGWAPGTPELARRVDAQRAEAPFFDDAPHDLLRALGTCWVREERRRPDGPRPARVVVSGTYDRPLLDAALLDGAWDRAAPFSACVTAELATQGWTEPAAGGFVIRSDPPMNPVHLTE